MSDIQTPNGLETAEALEDSDVMEVFQDPSGGVRKNKQALLSVLKTFFQEFTTLTTTGQTILARDGEDVLIGTSTILGDKVVISGDGATTSLNVFTSDATNNSQQGALKFTSDVNGRHAQIWGYRYATSGQLGLKFKTYNSAIIDAGEINHLGHFLLNTTSDPGETFHVGEGGARFTGTLGAIVLDGDGSSIDMTRVGDSYLYMNTVGGYLAIVTNGRVRSPSNANVVFNADQTTTFNGALLVDAISEKGSSGVNIEGLLLKDQGFTNTVQWKYFHEEVSGSFSSLFTELSSWVTTTGKFMPAHGFILSSQSTITNIRRVDATTIRLTSILSSGASDTLDFQSADVGTPTITVMSNFDEQ